LWCRGIRGASTVPENTREAIVTASKELLQEILEVNAVEVDDVASVFFTTTPDLNAAFPAVAARQLGWTKVALLCGHEMNVPGSLPRCLRVLMLVNTEKRDAEIVHVYLRGAEGLKEEADEPGLGEG